ncbi:hypothetical protein PoB_007211500 [Plakobranchus ocellatus]|uniref:Uncharacterized protein n=1 Tax=Plakobranchus ocellatus TaxID=259542 RepID=A0AAV4DN99_9GAST|nr:hypothetical protein PoB_007211500 [Plakobranchus ocellatus]
MPRTRPVQKSFISSHVSSGVGGKRVNEPAMKSTAIFLRRVPVRACHQQHPRKTRPASGFGWSLKSSAPACYGQPEREELQNLEIEATAFASQSFSCSQYVIARLTTDLLLSP